MRAILFLLLLPFAAHAQINKCLQPDGSIRYSDRPCPAAAKAETVRIIKDTSSTPYIPDLTAPTVASVATVTSATPVAAEPNPRSISYRCEAQSGQAWYLHDKRCPKTARLSVDGRSPGWRETAVMAQAEVTETVVNRREACKAIEAVDADSRPGATMDQKDSTQDKAMGRDHC